MLPPHVIVTVIAVIAISLVALSAVGVIYLLPKYNSKNAADNTDDTDDKKSSNKSDQYIETINKYNKEYNSKNSQTAIVKTTSNILYALGGIVLAWFALVLVVRTLSYFVPAAHTLYSTASGVGSQVIGKMGGSLEH